MTPILILVAFLALAAGYFAGRFTARAAADARSAELQRALQDMQTQKAVAEARLQAERVQAAEVARRQAEELKKEFHAIASDLARTESESLQHRHTEALRALLHPFDADLKRFYDRFTEGNVAMRTNIEQLIRQTQTVGKQAEELTRALRSNTKVQGNWGEGILADLLEASGLRIGQEYDTQVNVKDEQQLSPRRSRTPPRQARVDHRRKSVALRLCQLRQRLGRGRASTIYEGAPTIRAQAHRRTLGEAL